MKGSTYKRCGCRGEDGKRLGARCPKLRRKDGAWRAIATATVLLFVCDPHTDADVQDAVLNAERLAGDPIRAELDTQMDATFDFEAELDDVYRRAGIERP